MKRIAVGSFLCLGILVGIVWWAGTTAKAQLLQQHPAPGQLIDVGGYRMHLHCVGQGRPTVIMDAGNNDFSLQWALVQPDVAAFTRVCVYDRAGFGWSEKGRMPRTSPTIVQELRTLLSNAKVEPPYVLVGHSFGGVNMRLYAHQHPDEVVGLVLVDSAHEEQTQRIPQLQHAASQAVGQFQIFGALSSLGLFALAPDEIPNRGLPNDALVQYRTILAATDYFGTTIAETAALEQSYQAVRAAAISDLGDLPVIVLSRGQPDPLPGMSPSEQQPYEQTWRELQAKLVELSSNSSQVIAEQSGHYIQLAQPELVIQAIRRIISR
jgi:pimeloyl-ACP methyl ester carboxylesterase